MNERQALLDAILENPDDDLARLVFADWLQENGEEDFAEYIRVEIEWARSGPGEEVDRFAYTEEQRSLWHRRERIRNNKPWPTAHLPEWARESERKRGFIHTIHAHTEQWIADGDSILAAEPIECLIVDFHGSIPSPPNMTLRDEARILIPPFHLKANRRIRRLESRFFTDEWLIELANSMSFHTLRELALCSNNWIDRPDGFRALAQSRLCGELRVLDLSFSPFRADIVEALAASPYLTQLRELNLASTDVGTDGAKAIAESANFRHLEVLNFSGSELNNAQPKVGDEGVLALAESPHLTRLRVLDLSENDLTDASASAIAESPTFDNLQTLKMWSNSMTEAALAQLFTSPYLLDLRELGISLHSSNVEWSGGMFAGLDGLPSLETLDLRWGGLTHMQLIDLMDSPVVGRVKTLCLEGNRLMEFPNHAAVAFRTQVYSTLESFDLRYSPVGDGGTATISCNAWQKLTSLDLTECNISALGARLLALSPNFSAVRFLSLDYNPIGSEGAIALADSSNFPALRHLKLERCGIDDDALESMLASRLFHSLHSLELDGNSLSDEAKIKLRREFPGADFTF